MNERGHADPLCLGLCQGGDHDIEAGPEEHFVRALHPDLERVPHGHVTVAGGHEVIGLEDAFQHESGDVELVVIVKPKKTLKFK